MTSANILHCNVTRATLDAIRDTFGASYRFVQLGADGDILVADRVALVIAGVDREVAGLPRHFAAPTVVIARRPSTEQELQALEAGAIDYLSDVTPLPVLAARLRNHLALALRTLVQPDRPRHSPALNAHATAQRELEGMLRAAMGTSQFMVHYQPKLDVRSGAIVAGEALIRWNHPDRGLMSPADFIPLAEATHLIIPIGKWLIDTVCAQQAAWRAQGIPIVPVAVNLSALQFNGSDILDDVQSALRTHEVNPHHIELELTETLVMQDPAAAEETMRALRDAGLHLSLDDFGTGYSSLAYLKRFPFSSVKIDRAFITDITTNPDDAAIAKAIIGMGHSLQLKVIAEGVETAEQLQVLREIGCDQVQGFHFSRPVPAAEFGDMLRARKHLRAVDRCDGANAAPVKRSAA